MNDKDNEAFEQWAMIEFGDSYADRPLNYERQIFQTACEYKQKQISELKIVGEPITDQLLKELEH